MEHTGMTFHGMICALIAGSFAASVVAAPDSAEADKSPSADCAKFSQQADADIGDIIRAGCKPTLAQMSALISLGADGLITDDPALARSVLRQRAELTPLERWIVAIGARFGLVEGADAISETGDA